MAGKCRHGLLAPRLAFGAVTAATGSLAACSSSMKLGAASGIVSMNCFVIGARQDWQQKRMVTVPFDCSALSGLRDDAG